MTEVILKRPIECAESEQADFEKMVIKGGEVDTTRLRQNISKAERLAFLYVGKVLAGVGALKRPIESYKQKTFCKANVPEAANDFDFEIGWCYVEDNLKEHGYSRRIMINLLGCAEGLSFYITTRETNTPSQRIRQRFGLMLSGKPYKSKRGDHKMVLITRISAEKFTSD